MKTKITYSRYSEDVTKLVHMVNDYNFGKSPITRIVGVCAFPRGGLPIAVHLSHHCNLTFYECISNHDNFGNEGRGKVLLVDDIVDTGDCMGSFYYENKNDYELVTACLYFRARTSHFRPDMYAENCSDFGWVVFPWEDGSEHIEDSE